MRHIGTTQGAKSATLISVRADVEVPEFVVGDGQVALPLGVAGVGVGESLPNGQG